MRWCWWHGAYDGFICPRCGPLPVFAGWALALGIVLGLVGVVGVRSGSPAVGWFFVYWAVAVLAIACVMWWTFFRRLRDESRAGDR